MGSVGLFLQTASLQNFGYLPEILNTHLPNSTSPDMAAMTANVVLSRIMGTRQKRRAVFANKQVNRTLTYSGLYFYILKMQTIRLLKNFFAHHSQKCFLQ